MDAALCSIKGNKLYYAGANNPLWLFRNGELEIFQSDRQPVGRYEHEKPSSCQEIDLIKGDTVYIFSDGLSISLHSKLFSRIRHGMPHNHACSHRAVGSNEYAYGTVCKHLRGFRALERALH